jgi:alpha-1,3-rhamnosyl/mannosyltransferase
MSVYVIDGRHIQDRFPGIGRYVFDLALNLTRVAPSEKFRIVVNSRPANTRYDLKALVQSPNAELVEVGAAAVSAREQWLGAVRAATRDALLWHSAFYVMPYLLPMRAVVTLEDVTPLIVREEMPNPARRLLYRGLNLLAARRAARIITLSEASRAELADSLRIPRAKVVVIPLAAGADFRPTSAAEQACAREKLGLPTAYALYVGSNKPHKNLTRLVETWSQVETDCVLVIAGHWDARYPEAILRARALGIESRVLFRHDVPSGDLPALLGGARLFVFPSLHEGFGLPPLEAMACGTPVACANASSLPEVVGDAALTFNPRAAAEMARALTRALSDAGLRDELRAKGLGRAHELSWERTARETLQVYRAALDT